MLGIRISKPERRTPVIERLVTARRSSARRIPPSFKMVGPTVDRSPFGIEHFVVRGRAYVSQRRFLARPDCCEVLLRDFECRVIRAAVQGGRKLKLERVVLPEAHMTDFVRSGWLAEHEVTTAWAREPRNDCHRKKPPND